MKKLFSAAFILFFSLTAAFSQRIISPVEGKFSNRQCLILDLSDGSEAYYSYTNTNPLSSGFAYDGPVLIDAAGEVSVRIVVVNGEKKEQYEINYSVAEDGNPFKEGTAEKKFIDSLISESVLMCSSDNVIYIPETLFFKIGDGEKPFLKGSALSVSADNKLSRYIPCIVSDKNHNWRFVIHLSGGEAGLFAKFSVPFEIDDWETFRFTGKNLIWCIDNGMWSASTLPVKLDRSKTHIIYWQSVAYEKGNPVQSFVLVPKPELKKEYYNGSVVFSIDGDLRYRMEVLKSGVSGEVYENSGVFTTLTFDTFEGDCISGNAVFAFYCDGVYQGNLTSDYIVDRQPPLPPEFIPSEQGFYARNDISLSIKSEKDAEVYYSVSGPYAVKTNSYLEPETLIDEIPLSKYLSYSNRPLFLRAGTDSAVYYKVVSYAVDPFQNKSEISEYKVIIDEFNYFLDATAPFSEMCDGSRNNPYTSFEQVLKVINEGRFAHFFVKGNVVLPKGECIISSNCSFTAVDENTQFVFSPSTFITVRSASFDIHNCVLEKQLPRSVSSDSRFFILENSVANFEGCELMVNFDYSGTAFTSHASVINFINSGLTVQSVNYACGISGVDSKLLLKNSHFASLAETAVNFSVSGGMFEMNSSECKVSAHLGRIIESTGTNLRLNGNWYRGDFDKKKKGVSPVWKDENSLVVEDKNNISEGF
ncbi:hypothetical protein [Treponema sp.]|uniref:hypothetical protein n=1 Tax=Treponema sp. TaxID=166 RepID=UPI00388E51A2